MHRSWAITSSVLLCECKKVVSDILDKIEFFIGNKNKNTQFKLWCRSEIEVGAFLWKKEDNEKQNNTKTFGYKMASPATWQNADTTFFHSHIDMIMLAFVEINVD